MFIEDCYLIFWYHILKEKKQNQIVQKQKNARILYSVWMINVYAMKEMIGFGMDAYAGIVRNKALFAVPNY